MRPYGGPRDLRAMQRLTQRIWSLTSQCHIGDLAWQRYQHLGREAEWPTALWESDGVVVAWGWAELPGDLMLLVDPARPELVDDVLSWFAEVATGERLSVTVLDAETHVISALERHGYAREDGLSFMSYHSRRLEGLPVPFLPTAFVARPVRGEHDLARRVVVHRVVWNPSRVTEGSYRNVMTAWPYRSELDWVVGVCSLNRPVRPGVLPGQAAFSGMSWVMS